MGPVDANESYPAGDDSVSRGVSSSADWPARSRAADVPGSQRKFARLNCRVFMSLDLEMYQAQLDRSLSWLLSVPGPARDCAAGNRSANDQPGAGMNHQDD